MSTELICSMMTARRERNHKLDRIAFQGNAMKRWSCKGSVNILALEGEINGAGKEKGAEATISRSFINDVIFAAIKADS
jgi:hypothetical protein